MMATIRIDITLFEGQRERSKEATAGSTIVQGDSWMFDFITAVMPMKSKATSYS